MVTALKVRMPSYMVPLVYATLRSPVRATPGTTGATIASGEAAATGLRPARELGPVQFRRIV